MNSPRSPQHRAYFLPPSWVLFDDGETLAAHDVHARQSIELQGVLRAATLDSATGKAGAPPALSGLASLGGIDPSLAAFAAALDQGRLGALDRAAVLRGSRFGLLFVELTARCNETCIHCYAESSPQRSEELTAEALREVLDDARQVGFSAVQLTGGDPLISSLLLPAVRQARELDFGLIEIYTNGLALTGPLWEQLRALPVSYSFSFYSSVPALHDAITRLPGSQQRSARAIRRAVEAGRPVRVGIIVMEHNRHTVAETLRFVRELGVDERAIGVSYQRAVGRGGLTEEKAGERPAASTPAGEDKSEGSGGDPVAGAARGGDSTHGLRGDDPFVGKATVAADGSVYPCIFSRMFCLGNIYERRLREILSEPVPLRLSPDTLLDDVGEWWKKLSCWECRVRASLLAAHPGGAEDLIPDRVIP